MNQNSNSTITLSQLTAEPLEGAEAAAQLTDAELVSAIKRCAVAGPDHIDTMMLLITEKVQRAFAEFAACNAAGVPVRDKILLH